MTWCDDLGGDSRACFSNLMNYELFELNEPFEENVQNWGGSSSGDSSTADRMQMVWNWSICQRQPSSLRFKVFVTVSIIARDKWEMCSFWTAPRKVYGRVGKTAARLQFPFARGIRFSVMSLCIIYLYAQLR